MSIVAHAEKKGRFLCEKHDKSWKREGLFVEPDGLAMLEPAASRVRQLGWERLSLDLSCLLSLLSSSYCPTSVTSPQLVWCYWPS